MNPDEIILTDKKGQEVKNDDVLFDGKTYWRYCITKANGTYLLSCTDGYEHDLTKIKSMEIIGKFKDHIDKFECD
jgi:hypothetical protein